MLEARLPTRSVPSYLMHLLPLLCVLLLSGGADASPEPSPSVESKAPATQRALQVTTPAKSNPSQSAEVAPLKKDSEKQDGRNASSQQTVSRGDGNTEQEAVLWALVSALAASAAAIIALGQAAMFWRQLRLMGKEIDLSRAEFKASHRPWIKFKAELVVADQRVHPSPVLFEESGMYVTIKFTMTNVGTVPALNVFPEYKLVLKEKSRDFLIEAQNEICADVKSRNNGKYACGLPVFPGETVDVTLTCHVPQADIDAEEDRFRDTRARFCDVKIITVSAVGCIDYSSSIDLSHHHTRFCYHICATQAMGGQMGLGGPLLPVQSEPIPISDLYLAPNFMDALFLAD